MLILGKYITFVCHISDVMYLDSTGMAMARAHYADRLCVIEYEASTVTSLPPSLLLTLGPGNDLRLAPGLEPRLRER